MRYTHLSGQSLLSCTSFNKGSAFSNSERDEFNLHGLVPAVVESIDEQSERIRFQLNRFTTDEARHIFLRNLQDTNEVLFYHYITSNIDDSLPLIYTPTVGYACQHFSEIWRKNRGLFISWEDRNKIESILRNVIGDEIKIIVITDGERILGLGDQGIGGMGIPIGKLSLYTACGGIPPHQCLPIMLDVGTNNQELLNNPLYMGARHPRILDSEYYEFIDTVISSIERRWPGVLLQFEDFALKHATPLLQMYKDKLCCFNDDIQGTATVALGSILAACLHNNIRLSEQRIMFVGAGSAGCGIAELIIAALRNDGLDEDVARSHIFLVDKDGLILKDTPMLTDFQYRLAHTRESLSFSPDGKDLAELVTHIQPSILIGVSGVPGLFTEEVVKSMYSSFTMPIILPLSNPTSRVEAVPKDIIEWTDGNVIIATGSPFQPVIYNGKKYIISQCNNSYIFPGLGLGVLISKAKRVTENMFLAASKVLAESSPMIENPEGTLLPELTNIHDISKKIAIAVALAGVEDGVAKQMTVFELKDELENTFWKPEYQNYKRISF
ncbi:NAD-dependent malic enzyme [Hafnia alvei]|jgi:malate dehydrogenase (oxaloacetate-decarboxylating)|nr:NAD-dependent malic enzyme [Hafnia alvei]MDU7484060.1 NAD-dependent malic enzyme [Hafnia alvei]TBL89278.1 NAD-dependent malic enzyme [Hafnia alvei]